MPKKITSALRVKSVKKKKENKEKPDSPSMLNKVKSVSTWAKGSNAGPNPGIINLEVYLKIFLLFTSDMKAIFTGKKKLFQLVSILFFKLILTVKFAPARPIEYAAKNLHCPEARQSGEDILFSHLRSWTSAVNQLRRLGRLLSGPQTQRLALPVDDHHLLLDLYVICSPQPA